MRVLKRVPVYKNDSRSNIIHLKGKSGVYHIYEGNKRVYIGHSSYNLYKTILRHFQSWDDPAQPGRITYANKRKSRYTVKVWLTSAYDAPILEETHILKYRPRDNKMKVDTYSERQRKRVLKRFKKANPIQQQEVPEWDRYSYNADGELLDENGKVIF